jgi:hypothetical protein
MGLSLVHESRNCESSAVSPWAFCEGYIGGKTGMDLVDSLGCGHDSHMGGLGNRRGIEFCQLIDIFYDTTEITFETHKLLFRQPKTSQPCNVNNCFA